MITLGSLEKFSKKITDNIQIGIFNNEVVPILKYDGNYQKLSYNKTVDKSGSLVEVIEEVLYNSLEEENCEYSYLITRSKGASGKEIDALNLTKISLIFESDNILQLWTPTFEEILMMIDIAPSYRREAVIYTKAINDALSKTTDVNIYDIITEHSSYGEIANFGRLYLNKKEKITICDIGIYTLLKHIMISEDMRYKGTGQFGRYLVQLAIFDFVKNGMTIQEIKEKYKLN